ncbi:MAG TPA: 3-dehydroquinate synthase [Kineosporiaceae bacterium]|nr:3-dehydroquinate synthase [Kineosporiaceae bacterium]
MTAEPATEGVTRLRVGPGTAGAAPVPAGSSGGGYDVLIGHDLVSSVPPLLAGAQRVLVVGSRALPEPAGQVAEALAAAGYEVHSVQVPDAEAGKSVAVLEQGWRQLARAGFTRSDAVVGVGGGAVTDLAGFLAASWLRGVRVVQVATTVVGMVDAAVGGKTGINVPEGKNLVGAFHPPAGVVCDLTWLRTLPRPDLVAGLAEVVKCGLIADPRILQLVEEDVDAATRWDSGVLRELVERAVAVKAQVVTEDLTEAGLREILNYGHTFGHAVEQVEGYTWRHGDAVAVGMVYAGELGRLAGITPAQIVTRTRDLLARLGLPAGYPQGRWESLRTAMGRDKKTRGSRLRFVVLSGVGQPQRLENPDEALLEQAYAAAGAG